MINLSRYHRQSRALLIAATRQSRQLDIALAEPSTTLGLHHIGTRSLATRRRRSKVGDDSQEEPTHRIPPSLTSVDFTSGVIGSSATRGTPDDDEDVESLRHREQLDQDLLAFHSQPKRYKPALRPEDDLTPAQREALEDNRSDRQRERQRLGKDKKLLMGRSNDVDFDSEEVNQDDENEFDEDLEIDFEDEDNEIETETETGPTKTEMSKKLLSLANVHYRHVERLPEWFLERQQEILSHRTPAQIRRCLKSWMMKYDQDLMNKYRQRVIGWKENQDIDNSNHNHSSSDGNNSSNNPQRMIYGPEETTAYAYYHMPARYTVQTRLFQELKQLFPTNQFQPKRILDFGCGPATGAAAAATVWSVESGDLYSYTGIEISQAMIDAGKIMTRDLIPNVTFWTRNADILTRALAKGERYDLIIASYTLTELPSDAARKAATQMLYELLDINGILVLVEQGNPFGSHTIRTARQFLIDMMKNVNEDGQFVNPNYLVLNSQQRDADQALKKNKKKNGKDKKDESHSDDDDEDESEGEGEYEIFNKGKKHITTSGMMILPPPLPSRSTASSHTSTSSSVSGNNATINYTQLYAKVIAPCTHDRKCPLPYGSWCSFSQRVHSGTIRKDAEEKYSYVIMQKLLKASGQGQSQEPSRSQGLASKEKEKDKNKLKNQHAFKSSSSSSTSTANNSDSTSWFSPPTWIPTSLREYFPLKKSTSDCQELLQYSPLQILQSFTTGFMSNLSAKGSLKKRQEAVQSMIQEADWDTYQPTLKREEYARLLRSPLKGTGHITMDLCLPNGHLHRYVHARSEVEALPRLYNAMRKVSWGGLLPAFMIEPTYTTMMRTRTTKQVGKDEKLMKRNSSGGERRSRRQGHGDDNDVEEQEAMKKALEAFLAAEKQQEQGKASSSNKRVNVTDSDNINAIMRQMAATADESAAVGRSRGGANRRRSSLSSRKEA